MKNNLSRSLGFALGCVLALLVFAADSQAQTSTFTYQGNLTIGGTLANGSYDLQFKLYDQLTGGALQGSPSTVTVSGVTVTAGVFTVELDFGAAAFPGAARFLEISVRPAGSGGFTMLAPRQHLSSTPYAIRSLSAASADTATTASNAATATNATNFSGSLVGDVTGTQGATVVSLVGGVTASNIASGATVANNATNANTPGAIVKRDASGNFSAGTITATGFSGGGANLTNLNASNLTSGSLLDSLLSSNVAKLTGDQTFTGNKIFSGANGLLATGVQGLGVIPATGAGVRMMWYPNKYAFRAGQTSGTEWDDDNIGYGSVAFGDMVKASNFNSVAMGFQTTSSGTSAVAMGHNVTASGNYAVGIGFQSTASGNNSVALGEFNQASGNNSVALGRFASTNGKSGSFVFNDTASNNTLAASADNQFNVRATGGLRLFASNDTSDTTKPGLFISGTTGDTQINGNLTVSGAISGGSFSNVALLNADNTFTANQTINANLIQSGTLVQFTPLNGFVAGGTYSTGSIPATGAGTRMMWYPKKAAFRAGNVSGTQWDDASIGDYSVALGKDSTASSDHSIAIGESNIVTGTNSGALGVSNSIPGFNSFALGRSNTVSSNNSASVGESNTSGGIHSYAFGYSNIVSGNDSAAVGVSNTASGIYSYAFGWMNTASGNQSLAFGTRANTNSKFGAFAFSDASTSSDFSATADNQFNVRAAGGLRLFASSDTSNETQPGLFISATTGNTQINGNLTVSGTISGTISGGGITNLNASNLVSGTVLDSLLSSNVATLTGNQTFTGNKFFSGANGLLATGTFNSGSIPATGEGTRMMWYPKKAAFRAGHLDNFGSTSWDDANVGEYSVAIGLGTKASGQSSTALGTRTTASGTGSVALGVSTTASGFASTALGSYASTNGKEGSFVYGDNSDPNAVSATANNQFVVRAQQMWFGTNNSVTATSGRFLETSTGAYLTTGGTWTNSSSRALKTNFAPVNAREVLRKVLQLPMQTWNYKAEDARVRHLGAISQDFNRLFGLGDSAETISTVDSDGVALSAIQGLHEELKDRDARIERLEQQSKEQQALIDGLRKLLCAQTPRAEVCQR